jgi:hypothetical protein
MQNKETRPIDLSLTSITVNSMANGTQKYSAFIHVRFNRLTRHFCTNHRPNLRYFRIMTSSVQ